MRWPLVVAGVLSLGLHLGLLFGTGRAAKKAAPPKQEENVIALVLPPQLKELEEPEPVPSDDTAPPPDLGQLVPMQQDVPQLPMPSDFVQQINFASLIEKPDFSNINAYVIPDHIRTGGNLAEKIGKIFNLDQLDRIPVAVLQPQPTYPHAMRREGLGATVHIEFIVDTEGRVLNPVVVESSHNAFDDAAVAGVSRWKFRPGIRAGRKVNTRMRVPIVFRTLDPDI